MPVPKKKSKKKSAAGKNRDFDIVSADSSFWLKVAGGAVALPIAVGAVMNRMRRRGTLDAPELSTAGWMWAILGAALVGALVGAAFGMRDIVQRSQQHGGQPPLVLRALFGMGVVSLLIWIPLAIVVTLVVTLSIGN